MGLSVFKKLNGSTSCRLAIPVRLLQFSWLTPNHDRCPVKPAMWALHLDFAITLGPARWCWCWRNPLNQHEWRRMNISIMSAVLLRWVTFPIFAMELYLLPSHSRLAISPNHRMDIVDDIPQRLGSLLTVSLQKHLFVKRLNLLSSKRFPWSVSTSWKTQLVICLFEFIVSTSFKWACDKSLRLSWTYFNRALTHSLYWDVCSLSWVDNTHCLAQVEFTISRKWDVSIIQGQHLLGTYLT